VALQGLVASVLAGMLFFATNWTVAWIVASSLLISSGVFVAHLAAYVRGLARVRHAQESSLGH
jgi:hypothetical protein